jgi:hypothetical protein
MSINYSSQIAALGLPPAPDPRQIRVHEGNPSSPEFQANEAKLTQSALEYVKEAEQQQKPAVDLYDIAKGPGIGAFAQKIPAQDGVKAYSLGPDTLLIHSHNTPGQQPPAA